MTKEESDFLAACRLGQIEACRSALAKGVNPNCVDVRGIGALKKVILPKSCNREIVKLLIEHGVDTSKFSTHPVVIKLKGGPKLRPPIQKLKDSLADILTDLENKGMTFSFATTDLIRDFKTLGLPPAIRDFYEFAYPFSTPTDITFLDPMNLEENLEVMPGSSLGKRGLLPIASDMEGDNYCVDCHSFQSIQNSPVYHFVTAEYTEEYPQILDLAFDKWPSFIDFLYHTCSSAE